MSPRKPIRRRSPRKRTPVRGRAPVRKRPAARTAAVPPPPPQPLPTPVPVQAATPASYDRKWTWTVVSFFAALIAAEAIHWLVTSEAHPDATIVRVWLAVIQAVAGLGLLGWSVHRYRQAP